MFFLGYGDLRDLNIPVCCHPSELLGKLAVVIADEIGWVVIERRRFTELLRHPGIGGMTGSRPHGPRAVSPVR